MNEGIALIGQGWAVDASGNKAKNCWAPWLYIIRGFNMFFIEPREVKAPQQFAREASLLYTSHRGLLHAAKLVPNLRFHLDLVGTWQIVNRFTRSRALEAIAHPSPRCTAAHFKNMRRWPSI